MPNLISPSELNLDYVETIFNNNGQFTVLPPKTIPKRRHETIFIWVIGKNTYVKLVDNNQGDRVSIVSLTEEIHHGNVYQVEKLAKSEYKRRGHLMYIYQVLVCDYGYLIMSDEIHTTPGSMDFWKKVKTWNGSETSVLNIKTGYRRKYALQEEYRIWGLDEDFFIDSKLNSELIDDLVENREISKELYQFITDNEDHLTNKRHIRLVVKK